MKLMKKMSLPQKITLGFWLAVAAAALCAAYWIGMPGKY